MRRAAPGDLHAIEEIETTSFAAEDAFDRRQIRRLIVNPRAMVRVSTRETKVIGWAAALLRTSHHKTSARIYSLAIHPDARGLGLGQLLIESILASLRQVNRISLEVDSTNEAAIALYKKLGFVAATPLPHYYAKNRHAIRMIRKYKERL